MMHSAAMPYDGDGMNDRGGNGQGPSAGRENPLLVESGLLFGAPDFSKIEA